MTITERRLRKTNTGCCAVDSYSFSLLSQRAKMSSGIKRAGNTREKLGQEAKNENRTKRHTVPGVHVEPRYCTYEWSNLLTLSTRLHTTTMEILPGLKQSPCNEPTFKTWATVYERHLTSLNKNRRPTLVGSVWTLFGHFTAVESKPSCQPKLIYLKVWGMYHLTDLWGTFAWACLAESSSKQLRHAL